MKELMNSKITELQVIPIKARDGLVGFASFLYDGTFYLSSIGIYTRPEGGFRLTYPTRKSNSGINIGIYYPINKPFSDDLEKMVVEKISQFFILE